MVEAWLIDNDKETDHKFVIFKQNNDILNFCVYDIAKISQKMNSDLRENVVLSAVGYEICSDIERDRFLKS